MFETHEVGKRARVEASVLVEDQVVQVDTYVTRVVHSRRAITNLNVHRLCNTHRPARHLRVTCQ